MATYNLKYGLDPRKDHVLYRDEDHLVIYLGTNMSGSGDVDVNSYLIVNKKRGFLLDPGGYKIFPKVLSNVSKYINPKNIEYIYMCHQDPDVAGSVPLWRAITNAKLVTSWLWIRFLPHFGFEDVDSVAHPLPDEGEEITFGTTTLEFIPAHYLHSPGHFTIYDRRSKFLFTGDIGIAMLEEPSLIIEDMDKHIEAMKPLHEKLMANNHALKHWVNRVRNLDIEAIIPQHGGIIPRKHVNRFFNFLSNLKCGTDLLR
ncbi:CDP-abequose synthase [Methanofervidicoccus sp. A16]|uniref:MBL fold metallo-hydrolase n=1 Tax=Methanofervidicoccus sp. A16 TaxID=2607662 RepID=UPI00118CB44C|nr:MBL fold metallo-hydrolase [Methanofervidicoccus sp. A16]AXI24717.1 CDP-abequose synthase [Methanofervidicoccus sp. A16]MBW9220396.1 MBL fold metallo-hydrolase [Methanothermococcus sp. SCGC AD-155-N22]